nr:rhodanese-like domain protein [uncultured bacterium]
MQLQQFVVAQWQLVLIFVLSGVMLLWPLFQRRMSGVVDVTVNQLTRMLNDGQAVVVDIREQREFVDGKVPGAMHIPLSQLKTRLSELDRFKERPVIAYDTKGPRAQSAAATLARAGFKQLHSLHGGFKAWKDAGMPLDKN